MTAIPADTVTPHNRIEERLHIPVSSGSIFNFNQEAYERLVHFDQCCIRRNSPESWLGILILVAHTPHRISKEKR